MIKKIFLLLFVSSFCIARDVPSLVAEAEQLLGKLEEKAITLEGGQADAQRLYAEIERELKEAAPKVVDAQAADTVLFKLSNYFALQTPAPELAQEFTSAIEGVEAEWQKQSGKSFTELISSGDVYGLYSYFKLLFSKIGDFDVNTFFSILPYIGNMGYTKARELVKQAFIKGRKLTEPSPENRAMVEDFLKKVGYDHDIIILQWPEKVFSPRAAAWRLGPFRVIMLDYHLHLDSSPDFTLAHEIGHLFYSHQSVMVQKALFTFFALSLAHSFLSGPFSGARTIITESLAGGPFSGAHDTVAQLLKLLAVGLLIPGSMQTHEREADLFACHELIRQGRPDLVFSRMAGRGGSEEHYEKYWMPTLTESHPSLPESRLYLEHCLREHGLWGAFLESCDTCSIENGTLTCLCKDSHGNKRSSSVKLPCDSEIVNDNGTLKCVGVNT